MRGWSPTPLEIGDLAAVLSNNMRRSGNPLGLGSSQCSSWAEGLGIKRGGRILLYTSCMYQSVPYLVRIADLLDRLESGGRIAGLVVRAASRIFSASDIAGVPSSSLARFDEILRRIYRLLISAGVEPGYLYEEEPYSGALLYELGLEDEFRAQAQRVFEIFRKHGVERIITVDPHTHYVLSKVYPKYVEGFGLDVAHYLEILSRSGISPSPSKAHEDLVIHDPCLLARFSGIVAPQRDLMKKAGARFAEPRRSGIRTRCCGGPAEALSPGLSRIMGDLRARELASAGKNVVVMCPICFSSLSRVADKHGLKVLDISEVIS